MVLTTHNLTARKLVGARKGTQQM